MKVVAVVVTYNRRALALDAVAAVLAQTRAPDDVIVIDNASTDGTGTAIAAALPRATVHRLTRNIGGAGGFAYGMSVALRIGADQVWLLDDDTVPRPEALAELLAARERAETTPAIVASRVVWTDGRDHPMNTPRRKPFAGPAERRAAASIGCLPIRSASFVSILVDGQAVRRHGLPVADYFLWNDDFEFTTRVLRDARGLWCPTSVVEHRTALFGAAGVDPGDRFAYEVRNKIWLLTRSSSLAPHERVLYAAVTLVRWVLTIARSADRRHLVRLLGSGVVAGLRKGPRPTRDVLAGVHQVRVEEAG